MSLTISNSLAGDQEIKTKEIYVKLDITSNATPADKTHASDYPGIAYLRTEGKTTEADAIEDLSSDFTTAVDDSAGDSVFGVLLDGSELSNGTIDTVVDVTIKADPNGSDLATAYTLTPAVSGSYKTTENNIAVDIAGTGLDLSAESPSLVLRVVYRYK